MTHTVHTELHNLTTMQMEPTVAFPWQQWTLLYCWQLYLHNNKGIHSYVCGNNGYTSAPQCNTVHTLPILLPYPGNSACFVFLHVTVITIIWVFHHVVCILHTSLQWHWFGISPLSLQQHQLWLFTHPNNGNILGLPHDFPHILAVSLVWNFPTPNTGHMFGYLVWFVKHPANGTALGFLWTA